MKFFFRIGFLTAFLVGLLTLPTVKVQAFEHQLVRRVVVFPLKSDRIGSDSSSFSGSFSGATAEASSGALAEAWWQTREEFAKSKRFLVASKQFLIKSDVFQPRGDLEPADAIILGKLLDSHAMVTLELLGRKLWMNVYDGAYGTLLWRKSADLHPSLTVSDQLASLARRLVNDFIASIPYQGFASIDSLIGQPVFNEGEAKLSRVDLGIGSGAQIGDMVQWIRLTSTNSTPLFQGGAKMEVYAEGKIIKIDEGIATVEIGRATSIRDIKEYSLVRVPREADRLKNEYTISDSPRNTLSAELVSPEASPMERVARERKPLVTTLSFVGSIAAFLLLAF